MFSFFISQPTFQQLLAYVNATATRQLPEYVE